MIIDFGGTTVQSITETLSYGGGNDDIIRTVNNEELPVMRNGIARNGKCLVEVNDGGNYSKTLSELLALHSGIGESDVTVTIDGEEYSYRSLVTVSMIGDLGQTISIEWKGTNG